MAHGHVRRRQLGITASSAQLTRRLVRELDLLAEQAIEVVGIAPQGSAADAGILPGDLIVAVNDRVVTSVDDIHRLLSSLPVDQSLQMTVIRGKHKYDVTVLSSVAG